MARDLNRRYDSAEFHKRGYHMPKEEWGVKRLCPTTGKRFYDLNKNPIVSPYTGEVVEPETGKSRMIAADREDDDAVDVELDDDLLEDDEDDDVSLDDIADVASDDDD